MDNAKTRGRRPEAYRAYVEDRTAPQFNKVRRERRPAAGKVKGQAKLRLEFLLENEASYRQDPMDIETDIERIKLLAEANEDENWRFRAYLKGSDLSIAALDRLVWRHLDEVSRQIDCCACANCCRVMSPRHLQPLCRGVDGSPQRSIRPCP
jgi:hypothetical protein